jgi:hypothetical protein
MRNIYSGPLLVATLLIFGSCNKADIAPLELLNNCDGTGRYLSATIDGSEFCASSSLIVAMNGELNVTGISGISTTLQLQFASTDIGVHELDAAANTVMLLNTAGSWVTPDTLGGSLTVTQHDTIGNSIAGYFDALVRNTSGTAILPIEAEFRLDY